MATLAAVLVVVLFASTSAAFPSRLVHDRLYSQAAPWVAFRVNTPRVFQIGIRSLNASCADPVPGRNTPPTVRCPTDGTPRAHVWVHTFSAATGEVDEPIRCTSGLCVAERTLLPAEHALLVHGAPTSEGAAQFEITVDMLGASPRRVASRTVALGDDIMLDVRAAPSEGYDVLSVLVPDGPSGIRDEDGTFTVPGNDLNDWQGVLSTALWAFDERGRLVAADLRMSGVGAAGRLNNLSSRVAFVLARPFDSPPIGVVLPGSLVPAQVSNAEFPHDPGQGRLRLIVNPHRDSDGDNLSDQVEQEMHTCDGLNPYTTTDDQGQRWACMTEGALIRYGGQAWMDPRDTDGDGISDGAEVLGTDSVIGSRTNANGGPSTMPADIRVAIPSAGQTLPLWGFDARHKDVLIEIDRIPEQSGSCTPRNQFNGCTEVGSEHPVYPYTTSTLRVSVQSAFESLWNWHRGFSLLPASRVLNPDRRPGIEMHFDVSIAGGQGYPEIAAELFSTASYRFPRWVNNQVVPHRRGATGSIERFGKAGFVVFNPGASGSQCKCGWGFQAANPRHGGLAYYAPLTSGPGGQTGCGGNILGSAAFLPSQTQHEFGHVLGLDHGGPGPCNENPFRASRTELAFESKPGYWSLISYAYQDTLGAVGGRSPFSLGANRAYPSPSQFTDSNGRAFYGYQERNTFGYGQVGRLGFTDTMKYYTYQGVTLPPIDPVPFVPDRLFRSVDFDRNGEVASAPLVGPLSPSKAYAGGGTFLLRINDYYSPVDDAFVSAPVCPAGSERVPSMPGALVCRRPGGIVPPVFGIPTRNFASPTEPNTHTMTAVTNHAPFIANNRIYDLYLDDVVSQAVINTEPFETSPAPARCTRAQASAGECIFWQPRGKLRWMAIDQIGPRQKTSEIACSAPDDECAVVRPGTRSNGDIIVDGAPLERNGTTVISAAVVQSATTAPTLFAAIASRTGVQCIDRSQGVDDAVDCPWGEPALIAGDVRDIESQTSFAQRIELPSSWRQPTASIAVAAWDPENNGQPTAATVVVRSAATNRLSWARCSIDGACSQLRPLVGSNNAALSSSSQIALAVQESTGGRSLGLVFNSIGNGVERSGFVIHKLTVSSFAGVISESRHELHGSLPFRPRGIIRPTFGESGVSATFDSLGKLVLSAEVWGFRPTQFVSTGSPFAGPVASMLGPAFEDWWTSRRKWEGEVFTVARTATRLSPSPGTVWGLVLDDRPATVAIRPLPAPPSREDEYSDYNSTLARNFAGQVRAFALQFVGGGGSGPWVKVIARADGAPLAAQHDWDDSSTLAFNLCRNINLSSQGVRGGDTQPRLITDQNGAGVRNPIFCPSGAAFSEDSAVLINRFADRVIATGGGGLRNCTWCDRADFDIVVDVLTARNWGPSASPDTEFVPGEPVPPVAGCSVGAGINAWDRAAMETTR